MLGICTLAFFANGIEHAVATWLSSFGAHQRDLGEETMAIMTSNFWTAMALGRLGWAAFSGFVTSAWPSLFINTICCLGAGVLTFVPSKALLWSSAMGVGFGVASSFPAAMTLPAEMGIVMTPRMLTCLQLAASFGEMLCPFLMGIAFNARAYMLFGGLIVGWQIYVLLVLLISWGLLTKRIPLPACLVSKTGCRQAAPPSSGTSRSRSRQ